MSVRMAISIVTGPDVGQRNLGTRSNKPQGNPRDLIEQNNQAAYAPAVRGRQCPEFEFRALATRRPPQE